ncbi:MAG: histidine kinase, partial [Hyphomicrobium sp.]
MTGSPSDIAEPGAVGISASKSPAGPIGRMWYACPVRWQILFAIMLLTLLTGLTAGVFAVLDSRERARVETRANMTAWKKHILTRTKDLRGHTEIAQFAQQLASEMANVRHVSLRVMDLAGNTLTATPHAQSPRLSGEDRPGDTPDWFINLVQTERDSEIVEIRHAGQLIGSAAITGEPADEIAESWELLVTMAWLFAAAALLMMIGLYLVLGFILNPLVALAGGMNELEGGRYSYRIAPPRVRELAVIARRFNTLAGALAAANAENSKLYRQLIGVQEAERRQIARDLHDEFGPCLFGITAGVDSIRRQAQHLSPPQSDGIIKCVDEIASVTVHLKELNRQLLGRLRP